MFFKELFKVSIFIKQPNSIYIYSYLKPPIVTNICSNFRIPLTSKTFRSARRVNKKILLSLISYFMQAWITKELRTEIKYIP